MLQAEISRELKTLLRQKAVQAAHRVQGEQRENSQICSKTPAGLSAFCVCPGADLPGQPEAGLHLDSIKEPRMDNKAEEAQPAAGMNALSVEAAPVLAVSQGSCLGRLQQLSQVLPVFFPLGPAISPCPQHTNSCSIMLSTAGTLKNSCHTLKFLLHHAQHSRHTEEFMSYTQAFLHGLSSCRQQ